MKQIFLLLLLIFCVNASQYWPNGKLFYILNPSLNTDHVSLVDLAIKQFQENTCVRFESNFSISSDEEIEGDVEGSGREEENEENLSCDCSSIGAYKRGFIYISDVCLTLKDIIHQLMHSLNFHHEHTRHDRDFWLKNNSCLQDDTLYQMEDHGKELFIYDYRSILHHENNECIQPTARGAKGSGSPNGLSILDIDKINALYDCRGCLGHRWKNGMENASNALVSGIDINGNELVPCRAYHNGDIIPGEGVFKYGFCKVTYLGKNFQIEGKKVEFLTNPYGANMKWIQRAKGSLPHNAIKGGRTENGKEILYIGRCIKQLKDGTKSSNLGKIQLSANPSVMYFGSGSGELECSDHEVLVCDEETTTPLKDESTTTSSSRDVSTATTTLAKPTKRLADSSVTKIIIVKPEKYNANNASFSSNMIILTIISVMINSLTLIKTLM